MNITRVYSWCTGQHSTIFCMFLAATGSCTSSSPSHVVALSQIQGAFSKLSETLEIALCVWCQFVIKDAKYYLFLSIFVNICTFTQYVCREHSQSVFLTWKYNQADKHNNTYTQTNKHLCIYGFTHMHMHININTSTYICSYTMFRYLLKVY